MSNNLWLPSHSNMSILFVIYFLVHGRRRDTQIELENQIKIVSIVEDGPFLLLNRRCALSALALRLCLIRRIDTGCFFHGFRSATTALRLFLFFFLSCDDGDIVAASTVHTCRSVCPKVQFPFDFRPSVHARVGASRFLFLEREREEKKSGMATGLYKASQAKTWPLSPGFVIV